MEKEENGLKKCEPGSDVFVLVRVGKDRCQQCGKEVFVGVKICPVCGFNIFAGRIY